MAHAIFKGTGVLAFTLFMLCFPLGTMTTTDSTASIALGSGGCTVPESLLQDVFFAYRFVVANVSMSYMGTTTAKAMCRLKNYTKFCNPTDTIQPLSLDFVILSGPAGASDYVDSPDLQLYPVLGFAVVPIYNLGNVTGLVLSGQTLAQIFSGQILLWDDERIRRDNPGFAAWGLPAGQPIRVVVRAEACGSVMVLKQALAGFDPVFARTMDLTGNPVWPNLNATVAHGIMGMTSHVMVTPFTIGYSTAGDAQSCSVPIAKLLYRGNAIEASSTRIEYSIMELGALFGNNGEDPLRLTASIEGAVGNNTWPIAGYIYVGMRKTTRRPGAACENMAATVAFWQWFWASEVVTMLIHKHAMGTLPEAVRNTVLSRIASDMVCEGRHVAAQVEQLQVSGYGLSSISSLLERLLEIYTLVDDTMNATFTTLSSAQATADIPGLAPTAFWVSEHVSTAADQLSLPLVAVGVVAVSLYCLTLDLPTLASILDGNITTWLDPALLALNPQGIMDVNGNAIVNPYQRIVLLQGPAGPLAALEPVLRRAAPGYTGAAVRRAPQYASDVVLQTAVLGIPYAFAIATLSSNFGTDIQTASLQRPSGAVVAPSWPAIQACANDTVYDSRAQALPLYTSSLPACYPLATALFLTVTGEPCTAGTGATRRHLVAFVEWLLAGDAMAAALRQQQVAPLMGATPALSAMSAAALDAITCTPKPAATGNSWLVLVIAVVCGAGGALLVLGGIAFWHSTRQLRRLRQQFSNDNVAQECAAAIARFDLDAVAWLGALKSPNRIQRSFVQIVHLLKEVKPFIPDQLLKSLVGGDEGAASSSVEGSPRGVSPCRSTTGIPVRPAEGNGNKGDLALTSASSDSESGSPTLHHAGRGSPGRQPGVGPRRASVSSAVPRSVVVESPKGRPDDCRWTRRRCAFMYVKVEGQVAMDDPIALSDLAYVVSNLVVVAKKYGATIDRVGLDTVAVHWGLSSHVAEAALRAVQAAMEAEQTAADLFAAVRSPLRLYVGVGYGWCHVATLSASGHRFYVSAGPEISLATLVAHGDVARKCKCVVLISSSVQQEVRYHVRCSPRAWVGPVLVWEPVGLAAPREADEWMYELQRLDAGSDAAAAAAAAMAAVFAMVPAGPPLGAVETALDGLKARYGGELTAQDLASLDLLVATLPSRSRTTAMDS